jgi:hypothetical protein
MQTTKRLARVLLPVIGLGVVASACAYTQRQKAQQVEPMLSAAGFKMKLADTPEKLAKLQGMPQLKLKPLTRSGKVYYAYVDADGCRCTYLGDEAAYQSYQILRQQQQNARADTVAGNVNEDAAIVGDDSLWESWGPDD